MTHRLVAQLKFTVILGTLLATGSADCSIKIMDVERIIAREVRSVFILKKKK